jgi:hypothetical protein|eukprot:COSAG06_NODE_12506_length_1372_cov_3.146112_2_plen_92_part_00
MVRGHFLGGYLRPDIVAWILQGCLDDSYHVAQTVCQADDYPLRGHNGSAGRSAAARPRVADHEAHGSQIRSLKAFSLPIAATLYLLRPILV